MRRGFRFGESVPPPLLLIGLLVVIVVIVMISKSSFGRAGFDFSICSYSGSLVNAVGKAAWNSHYKGAIASTTTTGLQNFSYSPSTGNFSFKSGFPYQSIQSIQLTFTGLPPVTVGVNLVGTC